MSFWNVVCQDKVCVVKSEKYLKYEVPKSQIVKSTTVHFDKDLLNDIQIYFKEDTMCIALRFGMCSEDAGLDICNCRDDEEYFNIHINSEGQIWIPDVTMYSLKGVERLKILKPVGRL